MTSDRKVFSVWVQTYTHKNILESWFIRKVFKEKLNPGISFVTEIITLIATWLFFCFSPL